MGDLDHLIVDKFTSSLTGTRALATAFEVGLVDYLLETKTAERVTLRGELGIDGPGLDILLGILSSAGVVDEGGGGVALTDQFSEALKFRDLMEVRAHFSNLCAVDLIQCFSLLVAAPERFMQEARLFRLFDYGHAVKEGEESLRRTRDWVHITTTLTKYETPVVMKRHDFSRYASILDIGGNSGEYLRGICEAYPELRGTVFDLPLVCEVGRQHVAGSPAAGRIHFTPGDALSDPLPTGHDAVTFKSFLHDWTDDAARRFLQRAAETLDPGGEIVIFERGPMDLDKDSIPYHLVPYLLFARFFRTPGLYAEELDKLGFSDIAIKEIELEMTFYLVTARKK